MQSNQTLQALFGGIDIYLFDQLLKGNITSGMRVLDAGCGGGRNLIYFFQNGYEVFAADESEEAIASTRRLAALLAPQLPATNFRVEPIERMSWESAEANNADQTHLTQTHRTGFDVVISSAVLHFARDAEHWEAMLAEMWRVLRPGGILFVRLASTIGVEDKVTLVGGRRHRLGDGSVRFLVDAEMLHRAANNLEADFVEPIKTTIVENLRAMTTWVLRKK